MDEEYISSNTIGYIRVDKMFIKDVEELYKEYLIVKESLKKEIIKELSEPDPEQ
jgi:hypothetical protein